MPFSATQLVDYIMHHQLSLQQARFQVRVSVSDSCLAALPKGEARLCSTCS